MAYDDTWHLHARCRNNYSHLFFPPSTFERKDDRERREVRARAVCGTCKVRKECLEYALRIKEPYGIWGGHTESERRQLLAV